MVSCAIFYMFILTLCFIYYYDMQTYLFLLVFWYVQMMSDIHWSRCTFSCDKTPVPVWAELKSCMPIMDLANPSLYKCMKCEQKVPKVFWLQHALSCTFQPSQCRVCEEYMPVEVLGEHWKTCAESEKVLLSMTMRPYYMSGGKCPPRLVRHLLTDDPKK